MRLDLCIKFSYDVVQTTEPEFQINHLWCDRKKKLVHSLHTTQYHTHSHSATYSRLIHYIAYMQCLSAIFFSHFSLCFFIFLHHSVIFNVQSHKNVYSIRTDSLYANPFEISYIWYVDVHMWSGSEYTPFTSFLLFFSFYFNLYHIFIPLWMVMSFYASWSVVAPH